MEENLNQKKYSPINTTRRFSFRSYSPTAAIIKTGSAVAGGVMIGEAIAGPFGAVVGGVVGVGAAYFSTFGTDGKQRSHFGRGGKRR